MSMVSWSTRSARQRARVFRPNRQAVRMMAPAISVQLMVVTARLLPPTTASTPSSPRQGAR
jgi:hypothetical protein